eukprot:12088613-Alexandrium_andersonii.AAC.1
MLSIPLADVFLGHILGMRRRFLAKPANAAMPKRGRAAALDSPAGSSDAGPPSSARPPSLRLLPSKAAWRHL